MTYSRRGKKSEDSAKEVDGQIKIDGFQQVLEMLKIADPEFRESLLNRLAQRDRELANTLRKDLYQSDKTP